MSFIATSLSACRQLLRLLTTFTRTFGCAGLHWLIAGTLVVFGADRLAGRRLDIRHGLRAVYFAGPEWQHGDASSSTVDSLPSTSVLKQRRLDFASRSFSVEWPGFIVVLRGGTYTFAATSDDGSWVYVRGREVIANPGRHSPIEARGTIVVEPGLHSIFIRYFQDGGDCSFELQWAREGHSLD